MLIFVPITVFFIIFTLYVIVTINQEERDAILLQDTLQEEEFPEVYKSVRAPKSYSIFFKDRKGNYERFSVFATNELEAKWIFCKETTLTPWSILQIRKL